MLGRFPVLLNPLLSDFDLSSELIRLLVIIPVRCCGLELSFFVDATALVSSDEVITVVGESIGMAKLNTATSR